jgi:hypothetical protein
VVDAAGEWLAEIERTGKARITNAVLERHLIGLRPTSRDKGAFPCNFT